MNKLTHTERRYYDAWSAWRTFKKALQPWRFLNSKIVKRDHILMIEQFESMYNSRMAAKQQKEQIQREKDNFRPFATQAQGQGGQRANRAKSVL